ncbi:MAG: 50S ribosomal protein L25 [Desulfobulbus sp.]|nr:MAG: 50S ribosomal protein L25 [Desulfobulbus sp.]
MIQISMPAAFRSNFGKGASRQLRMKELTPAVVYSGGSDAVALQFETGVLYKNLVEIHGRNAIVTLKIDGDSKAERHALVKEVQKNPVTDQVVHVDFLEIVLDKPAIFSVPLKFVGSAKGVDLGGELHLHQKKVQLKGCPQDVPDAVEVDIRDLGRGDSLTFAEVKLPANVEMLGDAKTVCVSVI